MKIEPNNKRKLLIQFTSSSLLWWPNPAYTECPVGGERPAASLAQEKKEEEESELNVEVGLMIENFLYYEISTGKILNHKLCLR